MLFAAGAHCATASARIAVLDAPGMNAVALAGEGVVVAPEQKTIELVTPGAPPRVLAKGPGPGGGPPDQEAGTFLQFAASAQALAYETVFAPLYKGAATAGLEDTTGFGPLTGPYSPFPAAANQAACAPGYPGPPGSVELLSGAFAVEGTRLASWPSCSSPDAVLERDLSTPGVDRQIKLPDLGSPDAMGSPADDVGELALSGEALAALVGTTNAAGDPPKPPLFLVVENTTTNAPLYSSVALSGSGPIAVEGDGTAVIQLPERFLGGGRVSVATYALSPATPALREIYSGCVSTAGVKLAAGRVAQAVCGAGIVTTDLSGANPATVLALGQAPVTAFDYGGGRAAAVRKLCDGQDQVELASGGADTTPPPPTTCPARARATRVRLVRGAVHIPLRCVEGCTGALALRSGRFHASATFALPAPGGTVAIAIPRALQSAAAARGGVTLPGVLSTDTLTGAVRRSRVHLRVSG